MNNKHHIFDNKFYQIKRFHESFGTRIYMKNYNKIDRHAGQNRKKNLNMFLKYGVQIHVRYYQRLYLFFLN